MKSTVVLLMHFIISVMCAFLLASLFHTQFVLHELVSLGVVVDFNTRVNASFDDVVGLAPLYGSVIALALCIGFSMAKLVQTRITSQATWLFPLAGFVAMMTVLLVMQPIMDITLLAGARSLFGKFCQGFAGLFGGLVFIHLRYRLT